jgi:CMP/dCMP kinase
MSTKDRLDFHTTGKESFFAVKDFGMIVTIDGPAGSGKSTVARVLAGRLGFELLDTGAMYRAVALAAIRHGIPTQDADGVARLLPTIRIALPPGKVFLNDEDISRTIRTPEVSEGASQVAVHRPVREYLVALQRQTAQGRNFICEGRDQGTVVFPDAVRKFFLTANVETRARRREEELRFRGQIIPFDRVLEDMIRRDTRDARRDLAPMSPATDAVVIDTSDLPIEEVIQRLEMEVRACLRG